MGVKLFDNLASHLDAQVYLTWSFAGAIALLEDRKGLLVASSSRAAASVRFACSQCVCLRRHQHDLMTDEKVIGTY